MGLYSCSWNRIVTPIPYRLTRLSRIDTAPRSRRSCGDSRAFIDFQPWTGIWRQSLAKRGYTWFCDQASFTLQCQHRCHETWLEAMDHAASHVTDDTRGSIFISHGFPMVFPWFFHGFPMTYHQVGDTAEVWFSYHGHRRLTRGCWRPVSPPRPGKADDLRMALAKNHRHHSGLWMFMNVDTMSDDLWCCWFRTMFSWFINVDGLSMFMVYDLFFVMSFAEVLAATADGQDLRVFPGVQHALCEEEAVMPGSARVVGFRKIEVSYGRRHVAKIPKESIQFTTWIDGQQIFPVMGAKKCFVPICPYQFHGNSTNCEWNQTKSWRWSGWNMMRSSQPPVFRSKNFKLSSSNTLALPERCEECGKRKERGWVEPVNVLRNPPKEWRDRITSY